MSTAIIVGFIFLILLILVLSIVVVWLLIKNNENNNKRVSIDYDIDSASYNFQVPLTSNVPLTSQQIVFLQGSTGVAFAQPTGNTSNFLLFMGINDTFVEPLSYDIFLTISGTTGGAPPTQNTTTSLSSTITTVSSDSKTTVVGNSPLVGFNIPANQSDFGMRLSGTFVDIKEIKNCTITLSKTSYLSNFTIKKMLITFNYR